MTAMTSKLKVLFHFFVVLTVSSNCFGQNQAISDAVKTVFLTNALNSTDCEFILRSARQSYWLLKGYEKELEVNTKLNFVKNYGNFLLLLLKGLQAGDMTMENLFLIQNSFLKDYRPINVVRDFNVTELKERIDDVQSAAELYLISYYNTSDEGYDALEVLTLKETNFDRFLKKKLRADYSDIGYFFLEVFATLIGLSWGIISTALYITNSMIS